MHNTKDSLKRENQDRVATIYYFKNPVFSKICKKIGKYDSFSGKAEVNRI